MENDMDVTRGRDADWWLMAFQRRSLRLKKLLDNRAPMFAVSGEIKLIRDALDALDELKGQPNHLLVIVDNTFSK